MRRALAPPIQGHVKALGTGEGAEDILSIGS